MQPPCLKAIKSLYIVGLLGVMALAGCTSSGWGIIPTPTYEPSLVDSSILTGLPCVAPCWYGLEVNHSTKGDILATAQTLSFIDPQGTTEEPYGYFDPSTHANVAATLIRLKCRQPEEGTCTSLLVVNDVLKRIDLSPPPSLSFGQVVSSLGPPDYFVLSAVQDNAVLCDVALFWKQRGIRVAFFQGAFLNGSPHYEQVRCRAVQGSENVSPNLPVNGIAYESPDNFASISESEGYLHWSGFASP
jgi:hypothetical protein